MNNSPSPPKNNKAPQIINLLNKSYKDQIEKKQLRNFSQKDSINEYIINANILKNKSNLKQFINLKYDKTLITPNHQPRIHSKTVFNQLENNNSKTTQNINSLIHYYSHNRPRQLSQTNSSQRPLMKNKQQKLQPNLKINSTQIQLNTKNNKFIQEQEDDNDGEYDYENNQKQVVNSLKTTNTIFLPELMNTQQQKQNQRNKNSLNNNNNDKQQFQKPPKKPIYEYYQKEIKQHSSMSNYIKSKKSQQQQKLQQAKVQSIKDLKNNYIKQKLTKELSLYNSTQQLQENSPILQKSRTNSRIQDNKNNNNSNQENNNININNNSSKLKIIHPKNLPKRKRQSKSVLSREEDDQIQVFTQQQQKNSETIVLLQKEDNLEEIPELKDSIEIQTAGWKYKVNNNKIENKLHSQQCIHMQELQKSLSPRQFLEQSPTQQLNYSQLLHNSSQTQSPIKYFTKKERQKRHEKKQFRIRVKNEIDFVDIDLKQNNTRDLQSIKQMKNNINSLVTKLRQQEYELSETVNLNRKKHQKNKNNNNNSGNKKINSLINSLTLSRVDIEDFNNQQQNQQQYQSQQQHQQQYNCPFLQDNKSLKIINLDSQNITNSKLQQSLILQSQS